MELRKKRKAYNRHDTHTLWELKVAYAAAYQALKAVKLEPRFIALFVGETTISSLK